MKSVLLTGANGFIGKVTIPLLLEKGYVVHAVTSKTRVSKSKDNLIWHEVDLLDLVKTENLLGEVEPSHLLHLAWYVEHGKFWNAEENLDWLKSSINLVQQFVRYGGKRIVVAGTCFEYDFTENMPLTEYKTALRPNTLYGVTKYSLYLALEKFTSISNISFAWGRIFLLFGANESPNRLVPSVIRALLRNEKTKTSHGNQIRDFLSVEEVVEAFVALLESDVCGAVNIASGKGIKIREVVEEIAEIIGKPELLRIGALPAPADEPLEIVADITRLREEVRFKKDFNLRGRLEETIDYWKRVNENND